MNIIDIIFWGWYHILDKTIYSYGTQDRLIGSREHSFFVSFLFHGINLYTILGYITTTYFGFHVPLFVSLSLAITVFILGYISFFKKRANKILAYDVKTSKAIFYIAIALTYVILSIYFMFKVGNYVRDAQLP
jgi:hypothetical protein